MPPADHSHPHSFQDDHPEPETYHQLLGLALHEVLVDKGIYTIDELRSKVAGIEGITPETHGAQVVARAWVDSEFKEALLNDGYAAIKSMNLNPGYAEITILENTPDVHNVVVCTLCSCYPRSLLGRPPAWYKSKSYRARVVRDPRSVLTEFGTSIPDDQDVRVHDSTAELRYLVLPMRPEGTDEWKQSDLARLVTRDSMIGVARATAPDAL